MSNIGNKLKIFAIQNKLTLSQLAYKLNMKPQGLNNYLKGLRKPGADILKKLKDLGCDINWLLSDDVTPPPIINQNKNAFNIPILDAKVAASLNGYINQDHPDVKGYISLPDKILPKGKNYICVEVLGKSMEPTLAEGSYIIISETIQELKNNNIYVLITNDSTAHLKRIFIRNNEILCASDNPDKFSFPDYFINKNDISKVFELNIYITQKLYNKLNSEIDLLKEQIKELQDKLNLLNKDPKFFKDF